MKATLVALGFMAAVANADAFHPHHFHFRRDNITVPGEPQQTTLTVITTEVSTITSCAPIVTNCPADESDIATLPESEKTTMTVTNTVALTTTVCPVADASSISSSILSEASTVAPSAIVPSGITAPPMPKPTAPYGTNITSPVAVSSESPEQPSDGVSLSTTTTDIVSDTTLTYTQGTGTDAVIKTTTLHKTIHSTIVVTGTPETEEPTTTTTATSTDTTTLTVIPKTTDTALGNGGDHPTPTGGDSCECPTAVTVTIPASTVYVTIGGDVPTSTTEEASIPTTPATGDDEDCDDDEEEECDDDDEDCVEVPVDDDDDEDDDEECDDEPTGAPTKPEPTEPKPTTPPYPIGNGTFPTGAPAPTGFTRLRRYY
ncbi:hypothetical protein ACO1O0_006256 [Amphichorda felina]